ncbi:DUF2797 domain-containing protein [Mesonia sp. K7]|uniref:DUF2797 domain-containing protein n=1 Tax=Mesonia sp. K7 TaxID=2218606 RepID=UPI000DA8B00B|nr:DUF2797 domain-containing protein [Mesonia sp. K7]PZD78798.1 DUF2797 domain-containing protein [Mesonia sp. K7]
MLYEGVLVKMQTELKSEVQYYLVFNQDFIHVNQLLDKKVQLTFLKYECLNCHQDKQIYRQGFCKQCFYEVPQAADWVMRPELSKAHLDEEDRDLAYEKKVQLQPHIVYLANSSNVKVGVTRKVQVPTRWIDQGAHEAIEMVEVPNRYLAGIAEVSLKEHISDKTNWRTMLKNEIIDADLKAEKEKLIAFLPDEVKPYVKTNIEELNIKFPVLEFPKKLKSLNLEKEKTYSGVLKGIKGQYLIFEDSTVFNIRGNEGLYVGIDILA